MAAKLIKSLKLHLYNDQRISHSAVDKIYQLLHIQWNIAQQIAQNVKPRWLLMGGGHLREV